MPVKFVVSKSVLTGDEAIDQKKGDDTGDDSDRDTNLQILGVPRLFKREENIHVITSAVNHEVEKNRKLTLAVSKKLPAWQLPLMHVPP